MVLDIRALDVNREISPYDGMAKGNRDQYLSTGRNALASIRQVLLTAKLELSEISRVLDYACGYGRVLRWLKAAFPDAELKGVDVDKRAVASASDLLEVNTAVLDPSLAERIGGRFDLIWVGSLFTHLPEDEA